MLESLNKFGNFVNINAHTLRKMTYSIPNLARVHINAYTKFGQTLSVGPKGIELKQFSDIKQRPNYVTNEQTGTVSLPTLILTISIHIQNLVKLYQLNLKLLSRNEIQTSVKGDSSATTYKK